jgi:hypothetical protein
MTDEDCAIHHAPGNYVKLTPTTWPPTNHEGHARLLQHDTLVWYAVHCTDSDSGRSARQGNGQTRVTKEMRASSETSSHTPTAI